MLDGDKTLIRNPILSALSPHIKAPLQRVTHSPEQLNLARLINRLMPLCD